MKQNTMPAEEQLNHLECLAQEVLRYARDTLQVNMRYMQVALGQLQPEAYPGTLATDGVKLYYNARSVLICYRDCQELPTHIYLHSVFHCVFRHFYVTYVKNRRLWNLACDIAAEHAIAQLNLPCIRTGRDQAEQNALRELETHVKYMTAEHLYRYFDFSNLSDDLITQWEKIFVFDDHTIWYEKGKGRGHGDGTTVCDGDANDPSEGNETDNQSMVDALAKLREKWEGIAKGVQTNAEIRNALPGGTGIGTLPGDFLLDLQVVNRERYDYSEFLRKFATRGEIMKLNDDEFDYIFYTYGLQLYRNVPLIEPLEYKDVKRIREFVIAIDVSGSVCGKQVQSFINRTYNILLQEENFFTKVNIHIIHCDTEIKEDVKITSPREMETYIRNITERGIRGFGGTDFRPVFTYVDQLIQKGEFTNLKGMIYFTDGYGIYPERKPDYQAAFVFVTDDVVTPDVPPWAVKLVMAPEDLEESF